MPWMMYIFECGIGRGGRGVVDFFLLEENIVLLRFFMSVECRSCCWSSSTGASLFRAEGG